MAEKPPLGREKGTPWGEYTDFGGLEYGKVFESRVFDVHAMDRMLDRDGKAKAIEDVLTLPIRSAAWDIVPGPGDTGQAEAVKAMLERPANNGGMSTPMSGVIARATSAITYRKAFFEKVFKIHEGRVVLDKVASRPVSTCELAREEKHGGFAGFRQMPYSPGGALLHDVREDQYIHIPARRAWVYLHGEHRDPMHGVSDLQVPLWAHETKQKVLYLWFLFAENTALPKALAKSADEGKAKRAARQFAGMKGGAAMAMDDSVDLTPYESNGRGAEQFRAMLDWLDGEMAGSVLAGFMNLPNGQAGSYALSKDQSDFFVKARAAVATELADSFTSYVVADLVKYNWGLGASVPRFTFTSLVDVDVNQALTLLQGLASAQSSPLPDGFVYELADKVATYLDLDVTRLRKEMQAEADKRAEMAKLRASSEAQALKAGAVAGVAGAVNVAATRAGKEVARDAQRPALPAPARPAA